MTDPTDRGDDPTGAPRPTTEDRLRSYTLGASAAAMILVPTFGPVIAGTEEGAEDFDTEITPPDYAFAIWAPIFATAAANTIQHAMNPTAALNRRTGWWLAGAYTANTGWSIAAQSNRFHYTPFILAVATGFAAIAHRRAQCAPPRGGEHLIAHSSGLLLGWTSVASIVNAFASQRRGNLAPTTRRGRAAARRTVLIAAAAISALVATSRHGHTSIALASGWALATNAANPERMTRTRQFNAAGAALIAVTTVVKNWTMKTPRMF